MIPPFPLTRERAASLFHVPYAEVAAAARTANIAPASRDAFRVGLLLIDAQNTFCLPSGELFVGGRSGSGAVDDTLRLSQFIYEHLGGITEIIATLDTHTAPQIFHPPWWVDAAGHHPAPYTVISREDVEAGRWAFNPNLAATLGISPDAGQAHALHYVTRLESAGRFALTLWPYHAMLGSVGHAMVPMLEEALFFHGIARQTAPRWVLKGLHPLTERYSAFGPDVTESADGLPLELHDDALLRHLAGYDALIVAGQAKSHCVAWSVQDLLQYLQRNAPDRIHRVYLLDDACSPVVVPGLDFTDAAEAAFARFEAAGMHRVATNVPLEDWPGPLGARERV